MVSMQDEITPVKKCDVLFCCKSDQQKCCLQESLRVWLVHRTWTCLFNFYYSLSYHSEKHSRVFSSSSMCVQPFPWGPTLSELIHV